MKQKQNLYNLWDVARVVLKGNSSFSILILTKERKKEKKKNL